MIREIGSEFWDVPVEEINNGFFTESMQWFLSGRSALKAIIKDAGIYNITADSDKDALVMIAVNEYKMKKEK